MTISAWLMILAFGVGPGTSQLMQTSSYTYDTSTRPPLKPASNCWINGVWYNPCPTDSPPPPTGGDTLPEVQPPT